MKLTFLGTGSAFTSSPGNFQSNMVLENTDCERLLIDCGADIRRSLPSIGLSYRDIRNVYISHLHSDHAGGLEWLAFSHYFSPNAITPNLFIHPSLSKRLWEHVLSGGLQSLEGDSPAELSTFFKLAPILKEKYFTWSGIQFELVSVEHTYNGRVLSPSYGLFFETEGKKIFITTDTQFKPEKYSFYYQNADLIFHDCETSKRITGVHARFEDLATLSDEIKAKMWLYHYTDGVLPDAKSAGFCGFVSPGQRFFLTKDEKEK